MAILKVLVCGEHFSAGKKAIENEINRRNLTKEIQVEHCKSVDLGDVIQEYHVVFPFMTSVTAEHIKKATDLKLIYQFGAGLEGVDAEEATKRGIFVQNIPSGSAGNAESTAEIAIFHMLAGMKNINLAKIEFEAGRLGAPLSLQLKEKKVSVLGFGDIGKEIVKRVSGFCPQEIAIFKRCHPSNEELTMMKSLGEIFGFRSSFHSTLNPEYLCELKATDVLLVAMNLNRESRGMINSKVLEMLNPSCIIVNISRGQICVNDDILNALNKGKLGFFGSDVGCIPHGGTIDIAHAEPFNPKDPLALHPRTYFTPHNGGAADVSYRNMARIAVENLMTLKRSGKPTFWVNDLQL